MITKMIIEISSEVRSSQELKKILKDQIDSMEFDEALTKINNKSDIITTAATGSASCTMNSDGSWSCTGGVQWEF